MVIGLPAVSFMAAYRGDDEEALGIWETLEKETGVPQENITDVRLLYRDEAQGRRGQLSLRVVLQNPLTCDHVCRTVPFSWVLSCVSRYRPRRIQGQLSSS